MADEQTSEVETGQQADALGRKQLSKSSSTSGASKSAKKRTKKRGKRSRERATGNAAVGGSRGRRAFPALPIGEVITVPQAIRNLNGGNPWAPEEVANALELAPKANRFFYVTASSTAYGLTLGTRDTAQIELGPLGRKILYATSPDSERQGLKEAFFNVDLFKRVYEYYKGGSLPELKYLGNTLESVFGIPPQQHKDFVQVYTANLEYLNQQGALVEGDRVEPPTKHPGTDARTQHSIVIGEPKAKSSQVAFVILPFSERTERYPRGFFEEVLQTLITPAAIEAGFKVETARREGSDVIHSTIVNDLLAADLVIADLTEHNPNVLFELGLRMASEKPTALIRARGTAPIFDVDNLLRVYDYDPNLWRSTLELDFPKLAGHIRGTWEGKDAGTSYMQLLRKR